MKYTIIGSGVSGVNAALTLLERGKSVVMYDVGKEEEEFPFPALDFYRLKDNIDLPHDYFLGRNAEAIIPPCDKRGFVFPPARNFSIYDNDPLCTISKGSTFRPILSHNSGGLGVAWGANAIEFNAAELSVMGLSNNDFFEPYDILSKRISIAGPDMDALSGDLKTSITFSRPLKLNLHEKLLLKSANTKKNFADSSLHLGHSRLAVESRAGKANECIYCARCMWGCAVGAIYNPITTLKKCLDYKEFKYIKNSVVLSLISEQNKVVALKLYDTKKKTYSTVNCDKVLLAAGAINSAAIFLRTLNQDSRYNSNLNNYSHSTKSLLDTSVLKLPYIYPKMIGRKMNLDTMQFNKLIIGYVRRNFKSELDRYIHGEVVTLSSLLYHPIIEELPFSTNVNFNLFKYLKNAIGVVTYFLPDHCADTNYMTLKENNNSVSKDEIYLGYNESAEQIILKKELSKVTKRYFKQLGCYMPSKSHISSEVGGGIHYAGTIPYSKVENKLCTNKNGRCYSYNNLYVVDGAVLPALPSKSITLNLMANSIRIATKI